MNTKKSNQTDYNNDELDLGQLFNMIGNLLNRIVLFVKSIFVGLFYFLMRLLIFIKKTLKYAIITLVAGTIIGFILQEYIISKKYIGTINLETNFDSATHLYNDVDYYNSLIEEKKTDELQRIFAITEKEAESLKEFLAFSKTGRSEVVTMYAQTVSNLDPSLLESLTFETYLNSLRGLDFKKQTLAVESTDPTIFRKLQPAIVNSITNNNYFEERRRVTLQNISKTDSLLRANIHETDSVMNVVITAKMEEARRGILPTSNSFIMSELGKSDRKPVELELLERKIELSKLLNQNSHEQLKQSEVIKVISNFPNIGYQKEGILSNYTLLVPLLFLGILYSYILLLRFNNYLNKLEVRYKS